MPHETRRHPRCGLYGRRRVADACRRRDLGPRAVLNVAA